MGRVSQEILDRFIAFVDALPNEAKGKCAICSETLTCIVKSGEAQTGIPTAAATRIIAEKINENAAPQDMVSGKQLQDRVRYYDGSDKFGNSENKPAELQHTEKERKNTRTKGDKKHGHGKGKAGERKIGKKQKEIIDFLESRNDQVFLASEIAKALNFNPKTITARLKPIVAKNKILFVDGKKDARGVKAAGYAAVSFFERKKERSTKQDEVWQTVASRINALCDYISKNALFPPEGVREMTRCEVKSAWTLLFKHLEDFEDEK